MNLATSEYYAEPQPSPRALHPAAAGRTYAAYGCIYVALAIGWLWLIEGIQPTGWDMAGAMVALAGMAIIVPQPPG